MIIVKYWLMCYYQNMEIENDTDIDSVNGTDIGTKIVSDGEMDFYEKKVT